MTVFNRILSPEKDLDEPELEDSMISWISKSQTQISLRGFLQKMLDKQSLDGTPLCVTYKEILTKELDIITNLHENEKTKKHMLGTTGYQTLNIVETPVDTNKNQYGNQDEYNVHYGTNNSSSNNKPKQKYQPPNQNKIGILQNDQPSNDNKKPKFKLTFYAI